MVMGPKRKVFPRSPERGVKSGLALISWPPRCPLLLNWGLRLPPTRLFPTKDLGSRCNWTVDSAAWLLLPVMSSRKPWPEEIWSPRTMKAERPNCEDLLKIILSVLFSQYGEDGDVIARIVHPWSTRHRLTNCCKFPYIRPHIGTLNTDTSRPVWLYLIVWIKGLDISAQKGSSFLYHILLRHSSTNKAIKLLTQFKATFNGLAEHDQQVWRLIQRLLAWLRFKWRHD